jgi:guanylate kinase
VKSKFAIIISGPSGVGKGTIIKNICQNHPQFLLSVSHTTRKPREVEMESVDYFFTNEKLFLDMVKENKFIEWEKVHNNYYGTHIKNIENTNNYNVIFEVDVKGGLNLANKIKQQNRKCLSLFISPPSIDELIKRLQNRATETQESISQRMNTAKIELLKKKYFDYILVNDTINNVISKIEEIFIKEGVLENGK